MHADSPKLIGRETLLSKSPHGISLCERLLKGIDKKSLKHFARQLTQASVCQQIYNLLTLITIQDSAIIVHGPAGCVASSFGFSPLGRLGISRSRCQCPSGIQNWFSTALSENEVIHGGENKLRETILHADQTVKPAVLFVLTSCVSGIIGDDIASVIQQLQPNVNATLIPIVCEGFRRPAWGATCDSSYDALLKYLIEARPRDPNLANVMTSFTISGRDEIEISRLLGVLGLTPNFIPCFATLDDIKRSASAALSTTLTHSFGDSFIVELNKRYGIPYTNAPLPQSVASTDEWMLQIAQRFGKTEEARLWIEEEHKVLAPALEDLRRQLKGKRVFVGASLARAVSLSALSADLGFELVGLSSFQSDGRLSIANILHYEQANVINRLKPDLYIARGLTLPHASLFGVPMISLYDHTSCNLGYRGTLSIGQRMANALKNPSFFTKLSHHVPLPYRQSWYSQDPFKYLRSENEIRFNY